MSKPNKEPSRDDGGTGPVMSQQPSAMKGANSSSDILADGD